jgi:post-segregation antitoxin (ccd killing protein)
MGMETEQKITVHVSKDLLARARRASGAGVSETVRKGLELLAARDAYDQLLRLEGKLKISMDLDELRKDRA